MRNKLLSGRGIQPGRYAIIDIGTVTCRMLVADVDISDKTKSDSDITALAKTTPTITPIAKEYKITNLGEGVDATGMLSAAAIGRVHDALTGYIATRNRLNTPQNPVVKTVVFATSASRDAKNANDFTAMMHGLGLDVQIISGEQEAAMSYLGASLTSAKPSITDDNVVVLVDADAQTKEEDSDCAAAVVDIGGGSTEISIGYVGAQPVFSHSFDIGCRRVTERFFAVDPPTCDQFDAAQRWIQEELKSALDLRVVLETLYQGAAPSLYSGKTDLRLQMIAVAGTATTAVTVRDSMATYDSARVNGAVVAMSDIDAILERFRAASLDERREIIGLDPGRAPVIIAGMLILKSVMEALRVSAFIASDNDILEGATLVAAGYSF